MNQERKVRDRTGPVVFRDWHAIALLGAAVAFFFRDIILQRAWFWEDFITQAYPFRNFASVTLANGELPLWNPYTFAGMPFQADIQTGVFYLPNLLLVPFVSEGYLPFHAFEVAVVAHYWVAGITMYFLAREFMLEPAYAFFSALLFALSGFMIAQAIHPGFVQEVAWIPLIFLLYHRALTRKSPRYIVASGLVIGLTILAGAPQITLFLMLLLAFYSVFLFTQGGLSTHALAQRLHILWMPPIAIVVAVAVAAIQLLPTLELQPLSQRAALTYEQAQYGSMHIQQIFTIVVPRFFGIASAAHRDYWGVGDYGTFWETCFYLGIPGAVSAGFASRELKTNALVRFLFFVSVFAFLLALGKNFFLHRIFFSYVPGFGSFRFIGRATLLVTFAGALLGGIGLRSIVSAAATRGQLLRITAGIAGGVVLLLWLLVKTRLVFGSEWAVLDPSQFAYTLKQTGIAAAVTFAVALSLVAFAGGTIRKPFFLASLLLIQFVDIHIFGFAQNNGDMNGMTYFTRKDDEILQVVKEDGEDELFRIASRHASSLLLDRNHGMVERIFLVEGYTPLRLQRVEPPAATLARTYDLLNVKYRAGLQGGTGAAGLFEAKSYQPRAFIVTEAVIARTAGDVETLMRDSTFDASLVAVLEQNPDLKLDGAASGKGRATITSYGANHITVDVESPGNALLVLSEIFYPGWHAKVDGKTSPVLRANWSLRAVPISAVSRRVEIRFTPQSFMRGALISGFSLLGIGLFLSYPWLFRSSTRSRIARPAA